MYRRLFIYTWTTTNISVFLWRWLCPPPWTRISVLASRRCSNWMYGCRAKRLSNYRRLLINGWNGSASAHVIISSNLNWLNDSFWGRIWHCCQQKNFEMYFSQKFLVLQLANGDVYLTHDVMWKRRRTQVCIKSFEWNSRLMRACKIAYFSKWLLLVMMIKPPPPSS